MKKQILYRFIICGVLMVTLMFNGCTLNLNFPGMENNTTDQENVQVITKTEDDVIDTVEDSKGNTREIKLVECIAKPTIDYSNNFTSFLDENYYYYIFAHNDKTKNVRYICCTSLENGVDQPYYLQLDW